MATHPSILPDADDAPRGNWSAVYALTLCVSALVAAEFMPVSLLTPIAGELRLTDGQAGQTIAVSGMFAVATSLAIARLARQVDRRILLLWLTGLMALSSLLSALAPNYPVLLVGRALVGVAVGGFWSMSAATAMRLVPERDVPKALAILNGGNAFATVVAAPLGSVLGEYIGWRGAFATIAPIAATTLLWQYTTLPGMPSIARADAGGPFALLRRRRVRIGMAAVALFFMGQFGLFTYLRPFLENVTGLGVRALSLVLLIVGLSGLLGTWIIGFAITRGLRWLLVALPIAMGAIALGLIAFGAGAIAATILLALWGLIGTAAPVAWWTWLSRTLPDDTEAGGGLMVAVVQLAITAGAAGGGILFDAVGYHATFAASAAIFCASALAATLSARGGEQPRLTLDSSGQELHA